MYLLDGEKPRTTRFFTFNLKLKWEKYTGCLITFPIQLFLYSKYKIFC